jgi:hypothetical protein
MASLAEVTLKYAASDARGTLTPPALLTVILSMLASDPVSCSAGSENDAADPSLGGVTRRYTKGSFEEKNGSARIDIKPVSEDTTLEDDPSTEELSIFEPFPIDPSAPEETQQFTARAVITGCCLGERKPNHQTHDS